MAKKVCIVCGQGREGCAVIDDPVLAAIRAVKTRLGIAAGNVLVVCAEDIAKAQAKRARFERYLMWHGLLAAAVFFLVLFTSRSLLSIAGGAAAAALILLLSLVNYYPKVAAPGPGGTKT